MHPVYGRVFRRCISVLGGFRFWGVNVSWFVEKGCQHEGCRKRSGLYSWVIQQPAMLMSISTSRPFDTGKGFFRWSHVSLRPWVFFVTSSKKNDNERHVIMPCHLQFSGQSFRWRLVLTRRCRPPGRGLHGFLDPAGRWKSGSVVPSFRQVKPWRAKQNVEVGENWKMAHPWPNLEPKLPVGCRWNLRPCIKFLMSRVLMPDPFQAQHVASWSLTALGERKIGALLCTLTVFWITGRDLEVLQILLQLGLAYGCSWSSTTHSASNC